MLARPLSLDFSIADAEDVSLAYDGDHAAGGTTRFGVAAIVAGVFGIDAASDAYNSRSPNE